MFQKKKGIDIVVEIGGITSLKEAMQLFEKKLDEKNLSRIQKITHPEVVIKIANSIAMGKPDAVFINTGSESDKNHIKEMALRNGEEAKLPMENHTVHFDLKDEQGRIIDRTFYIANEGEDISSLANKMDRPKALIDIRDKMTGIMQGKTMIVGFYSRGPVGSPAS
ncbi:MAG: phosphoenolpyruvate carboxykinase, partial [Desulfobacteraceae bacterium]|nr:phosphoenolpyruvate carboxykinase [Desulfobacteraceae bacterium]